MQVPSDKPPAYREGWEPPLLACVSSTTRIETISRKPRIGAMASRIALPSM
jgi:hypothetical protein